MNAANIMHLEAPIIGYTPDSNTLGKFRKWHVESLLNRRLISSTALLEIEQSGMS
jgi:hypothetical protein